MASVYENPAGYVEQTGAGVLTIGTVPAGAKKAIVQPSGATRYRDDGTNPTAAIGLRLVADQQLVVPEEAFSDVKFIGEASITLRTSFYK